MCSKPRWLMWCLCLGSVLAAARLARAQDSTVVDQTPSDAAVAPAAPASDGAAQPAAAAQPDPDADPAMHFATDSLPVANRCATLELRSDATLYGNEIHLRQLCRWSDADAPVFTPIADLTLARFGRGHASRLISLDELRNLLRDANVNLAAIRFCGAMTCKVKRSDGATAADDDARAALEQWASQSAPAATKASLASARMNAPAAAAAASAANPAADAGLHTLRQELLNDLSQRLNVPADTLEVSFDPRDAGMLNLSEPNFTFDIRARRVHDLGDVRWDVTLMAAGNNDPAAAQHVTVNATARAWQEQVVLTRPISFREVFREQDVAEQRVLIDTLPDAPVLPRAQVVGQEAARDLQTGTVMTARLVEPVPLAKSGEFVTVTLACGTVQIRTVAKALEAGCYGQTIKLRNEETNDVFEATLIGPQQATVGTAPASASPTAYASTN